MEKKAGKFDHLKVGDALFMTKTYYHVGYKTEIEPCEVVKVGRKYVTVKRTADRWDNEYQFERETGYEKNEGYSQHRRQLVISEEQWYADHRRDAVYKEFHRKIDHQYNSTASEADIRAAAKLLGIELEEQE